MRKTLVIRADANTRMGTGHVMRCLALGQAWMDAEERAEGGGKKAEGGSLKPEDGEMSDGGGKKAEGGNLKPEDGEMSDGGGKKAEGGNLKADNSSLRSHPSSFPSVVFICAEIPDALAERVKSEDFELIRINAEKGSPEDLRQTLDIISTLRFQVSSFIPPTGLKSHPSSFTQWLVTDGYHFNLDYQRGIRAAGLKLLLIDDYNHLPEYEADILVNQNIGAEEIEYRCNPDCRKLLGTNYVMLRREFRTLEKRTRNFPTIGKNQQALTQSVPDIGTNLLVTLGGADPDNVTLKVIKALQHLDIPNLHVKIIVGPANLHLETLQQAVSLSTINCELINAARDMPGLMDWADFAITAAGSTCWELAVTGVPFMTVVLADNQEQVAQKLAQKMGALCMGRADAGLTDRITKQVREWLLTGPVAGLRSDFADRFGVDRILYKPAADAGRDFYKTRLVLRAASMDDAQLLFDWANDPVARKNSFNPEPISWEEHLSWVQLKIDSAESLLLLAELDGEPCGYVRYDRAQDGSMLLSFLVSPDFRGLGLASRIIQQSLNRAGSEFGDVVIKAYSFVENFRAHKAMLDAGFVMSREAFEYMGHNCSEFKVPANRTRRS
jgi:UDP-2,4-diacetamido-2,4,6-trideoxy-beta-L-altropyranose hydrolase